MTRGSEGLAGRDEHFMGIALEEAAAAAKLGEVPIGAVVVDPTGEVVGRGHNLRETSDDPTAHAEILALRQAGNRLGDWRLEGCQLYVTLEPCPMCAGAAVNARISRLIFGVHDPKAGAAGTLYNIPADSRLNHRMEVVGGVLAVECGNILRSFFRNLRSGSAPDLML
ncbi:MAG: tRNA adenosine(34) deaminase TadA [Clostridia bacterium]